MTIGSPVALRRSEKSPSLFSAVGTVEITASPVSCRVRSHEPKKKVLPSAIGPANVPPHWCSRIGGWVGAKKFLASSASLRGD